MKLWCGTDQDGTFSMRAGRPPQLAAATLCIPGCHRFFNNAGSAAASRKAVATTRRRPCSLHAGKDCAVAA